MDIIKFKNSVLNSFFYLNSVPIKDLFAYPATVKNIFKNALISLSV